MPNYTAHNVVNEQNMRQVGSLKNRTTFGRNALFVVIKKHGAHNSFFFCLG
jgi:hypothetical protein